ncbi:hypothetical protein DFP73DRAFT_569740 [Morchella snyderi]|nr:hypothetical protein DFP73DRAFT_569740 [Morchella snyderi]
MSMSMSSRRSIGGDDVGVRNGVSRASSFSFSFFSFLLIIFFPFFSPPVPVSSGLVSFCGFASLFFLVPAPVLRGLRGFAAAKSPSGSSFARRLGGALRALGAEEEVSEREEEVGVVERGGARDLRVGGGGGGGFWAWVWVWWSSLPISNSGNTVAGTCTGTATCAPPPPSTPPPLTAFPSAAASCTPLAAPLSPCREAIDLSVPAPPSSPGHQRVFARP